MPTQNLFRLLLLLMLMKRIVLVTVCCRFGSWCLVIKINFCSDFEHKGCSRFWSWSSGKIYSDLLLMPFSDYEVKSWSRFWSWVWSIFWILILVEMLMFGRDFEVDAWLILWNLIQVLCLNLWYGLNKLLWEAELNPRVRCAFENVSFLRSHPKIATVSARSAHNMEALLKELALRVLGSAVSFRCLGNSRCSKLEAVITNKQRPYFADFVSRNEKSPPSS